MGKDRLHHYIEGERVGVDGGEVVGVDRRHDGSPGGAPAPLEERGREPPFFFLLGLLPRWEKLFPSGPWPPWHPEGREPLRDWISLSVLFCFAFLFSGPSPFLKFPEICNSDCT